MKKQYEQQLQELAEILVTPERFTPEPDQSILKRYMLQFVELVQ